jgi:hypothetical protein
MGSCIPHCNNPLDATRLFTFATVLIPAFVNPCTVQAHLANHNVVSADQDKLDSCPMQTTCTILTVNVVTQGS